MSEAEKNHLSPSQLGMYLRCPRQWEYRYVDGLKIPPASALTLGKSFHKAVETNYRQKTESKTDLPVFDMTDCFSYDWHERVKAEEPVFNAERGETAGKLLDVGVGLVTAQRQEIAPKVQPVAVEETFEVALGDEFPYTLKGVVDGVTEDGVIFDNKTGARKIQQADVDKDIQLSAYSIGHRIRHQKRETALELHRVIKTKTPGTQIIRTTRSDDDLKWFLRLLEQVAGGIQAGTFPPNPTGWWCSPTSCGYYDICRQRRA